MTLEDNHTESDNNIGAQVAALKTQVFTLLVALVLVSGTLLATLYREACNTQKDVQQMKALEKSLPIKQNEAVINGLVNALVAYGNKHPDFIPVLKKYGLVSPSGAPAAPK